MLKKLEALRRAFTRTIIDPLTGCMLYQGSHSGTGRGGGYGRISCGGITHALHLLAFRVYHGRPVRPSYYLDHLCENRNCWRPDHLEEVRQSVNEKRKRRRRKTAPTGKPDLSWLGVEE